MSSVIMLPLGHKDRERELEKAMLSNTDKQGGLSDKVSKGSASLNAWTPSRNRLILWIGVNVSSTVAMVFANKAIFEDATLQKCHLLLTSFHFLITFLTLQICSSRTFRLFTPRRAGLRDILPMSVAMCLNVVLPNLSLAHSSITFSQTVRILLTPLTALLNYILFSTSISRLAILTLIPACLGVGLLTSSVAIHHPPSASPESTSLLGAVYALAGVLASALYTLAISHSRTRLALSPVQLLHHQSLVGALLLLACVPWTDTLPDLGVMTAREWTLLCVAGVCACLVNLSQFAVVAGAGAVGSTVVGHARTVAIVGMGWAVVGRGGTEDSGVIGIGMAVAGIVAYAAVSLGERREDGTGERKDDAN